MSVFPVTRLRRLRRTPALRALVRETHLEPSQLVYPLFVVEGTGVRTSLDGLPGIVHMSVDEAAKEAQTLLSLGLGGVLLFGVPSQKDEVGSGAFDEDGVAQQAIRAIKAAAPDLIVMTDVCLCSYTDHGHCGLVRNGEIDNDLSIEILAKVALTHAQAGADIVAPSDMMDGRVGAIRGMLDGEGFEHVALTAYSAKFASAMYGPFREAAHSTPSFGDRRSYQMDPANRREAMRECALDLEEGADMIMVKPALAYLDVIAEARDTFDVPLAAYHVSGEYGMVRAAAMRGWLDEKTAAIETTTSIRRAGADVIITYWARELASWL